MAWLVEFSTALDLARLHRSRVTQSEPLFHVIIAHTSLWLPVIPGVKTLLSVLKLPSTPIFTMFLQNARHSCVM